MKFVAVIFLASMVAIIASACGDVEHDGKAFDACDGVVDCCNLEWELFEFDPEWCFEQATSDNPPYFTLCLIECLENAHSEKDELRCPQECVD